MNVHNILEEEIFSRVKAIYKQAIAEKSPWLSCGCERCQTDTACFVLNRVTPKYIVSGRGAVYAEAAFNKQLVADLDALIIEGMQKISVTKRPFHNEPQNKHSTLTGPAFNFPALHGGVFAGNTFEPLMQGTISLLHDGKLAAMTDSSWVNPHVFNKQVHGSYSFWPVSLSAKTVGENRTFCFELKVETTDYAPLTMVVTVPVTSEEYGNAMSNAAISLKVQDIYLLPDDEE